MKLSGLFKRETNSQPKTDSKKETSKKSSQSQENLPNEADVPEVPADLDDFGIDESVQPEDTPAPSVEDDNLIDLDKSLQDLNNNVDLNTSLDKEVSQTDSTAPSQTFGSQPSSDYQNDFDVPSAVDYSQADQQQSDHLLTQEAYDRMGRDLDKYRQLYQTEHDDFEKFKKTAKSEKTRLELTTTSLQDSLRTAQSDSTDSIKELKDQVQLLESELKDTGTKQETAAKTISDLQFQLDNKDKIDRYKISQVVKEANDYKDYVLTEYQRKFGVIELSKKSN